MAKAGAEEIGLPLYRYVGGTDAHVLPVPMMNVINGGAHADNNIDLQEFMVVPVGADSFAEALRIGAETFHALKALLHGARPGHRGRRRGRLRARPGSRTRRRSRRSWRRPTAAGHRDAVAIAIDPASTEFYADGRYRLAGEGRVLSTRPRWSTIYEELCDRYPIVSIEDGLAEDDWDGWQQLTAAARRAACSWSATTCS